MPAMKFLTLIIASVLLLFGSSFSWAQKSTLSSQPAISVPMLPEVDVQADQAVRDWLNKKYETKISQPTITPSSDLNSLLKDQIETVKKILRFSRVPPDPRVNFNLRSIQQVGNLRAYSYPITSEYGDETLTVTLEKTVAGFKVRSIQSGSEVSLTPDFVSKPVGKWVFLALTALLAYATIAPTIWRTWIVQGLRLAKVHKRTFILTNILLYGVYLLGTMLGFVYPDLVQAVGEALGGALSRSGIGDTLKAGVVNAAFGIALNNARAGILLGSFLPGSFFAVPAYLFDMAQFFIYGFALAPVSNSAAFWWHVPTIILELQAYIFVTASAGAFLVRIFRKETFAQSFQSYLKCLPFALTLLVIAAWYEAFEIMVLIPTFVK
jgi:hypothetical protein